MSNEKYIEDLQNGSRKVFEQLMKGEIEVMHGQNQLFYNPKTIRWETWKVKGIQKPKILLDTICIKSAIRELTSNLD